MTNELCPACGAMDCFCALFQPDCPACLRPEEDCSCDEEFGLGDFRDNGEEDEEEDDHA